jgi:2Fe-2S ferredoxin
MRQGAAKCPAEMSYKERGCVVRVEPSGVSIEVREGETLMAAAERQGYRWPTICHGQAICTACCIVLDDNLEAFEPADQVELNGLELLRGRSFYEGKTVRLACQARVVASTVVTKRGVRRAASAEIAP